DYNSLYKVDVRTGAFTRIGSTGAPQLFMDLTFDRHGNMLGVTTTVNPSGTPAILYRIDRATAAATKLFNQVGSNRGMGLAFGLTPPSGPQGQQMLRGQRRAEVRPRAARTRSTANARGADPDTARHPGPVL